MCLLNPATADAICTAITVGFVKRAIADSNPPRTKLVYELPQEPLTPDKEKKEIKAAEARGKIATALSEMCGKAVEITQASPQAKQPLIAAKIKGLTDEQFQYLKNDYVILLETLHKQINAQTPPRGAYIGGLMKFLEKKIFFLGPSLLKTYNPQFRTILPDEQKKIREAYQDAAKATNDSLRCLREVFINHPVSGQQMPTIYLPEGNTGDNIADGELFGSCHGMIQAIMEFGQCITKDSACIEFALGSETTKVASCIPCSMFMEAAGMPATATHLGCGDNWRIPDPIPDPGPAHELTRGKISNGRCFVGLWEKNIEADYQAGKGMILSKLPTDAFRVLDSVSPEHLPDVFLEALTYEKSFTDRIVNTLKL